MTSPDRPRFAARLDSRDAARGGRSFEFHGLSAVIEAWEAEDVWPALRAVQAAAAEGRHAVGYVAYEAAPGLDAVLAVRPGAGTLPRVCFGVFEARAPASPPAAGDDAFALGEWRATLTEAEHRADVARIRECIAAGETYQLNHTFRLRADFRGDEAALYARLCRAQAAAYCAHLRIGSHSILSASPELFFRWAQGELELRPMKGTRVRGRSTREDRALAAELLASPKERAENLMIVDLLRNDAGRVAEIGSVTVPRLFDVERYPTVHQLTSTIRARTRSGTGLTDLFAALFPSGSVTGAPKIRTMQLIAELETTPRGVYTGAIGFVSPDEALFSVAIRTLVLDHARGEVELGVGGGITYDSDPAAEYGECLAKAAFVHHRAGEFELLESILYEPARGFFLLDEHLARLRDSAAYFGFACDPAAVRTALDDSVRGRAAPAKVRLRLDAGGRVAVDCEALGGSAEPVRVRLAARPVDSADPLLYHKTTARQLYDSRLAECPGCDDVLLVNERGELTESTIANLVVCLDGEAWTPPGDGGLLPGVFRGALLRSGRIRERTLRPADLERADAVYLVNSVRKWRRALVIE